MNMSNSGDAAYPEYPTIDYEIDPNTAPCSAGEVGTFTHSFGPAVLSVVFVVGLVGNGLVVAVLGRARCPWFLADCVLFQLALADLLLVTALPFWAAQFTQGWLFGEGLCKLFGALWAANSYSTAFLLAGLSVERYLAVLHAVQLQRRWKRLHTHLASAALWGISFCLSVVELHFRTVAFFPQKGRFLCHLGFEAREAESWRLGLRLTSFVLGFLLPVVAMVFCYSRILFRLRYTHLFSKLPALCLLVVLLVLFVLCWAPFYVFLILDSLQRLGHFARSCAWGRALDFGLLFTQSLSLVHCCLNPLAYAFAGGRFRRELSRLWHRRERSEEPGRSWDYDLATEHTAAQGLDYNYSVLM